MQQHLSDDEVVHPEIQAIAGQLQCQSISMEMVDSMVDELEETHEKGHIDRSELFVLSGEHEGHFQVMLSN